MLHDGENDAAEDDQHQSAENKGRDLHTYLNQQPEDSEKQYDRQQKHFPNQFIRNIAESSYSGKTKSQGR